MIRVLLVIMVVCGSVAATESDLSFLFDWVPGTPASGSDWQVFPVEPNTTDIVHFVGTTGAFSNYCTFRQWCGGGSSTRAFITVDSATRTAELWVQGRAIECTFEWDPVYGIVEGEIGPLTDGDWLFFSDDPSETFAIQLHVSSLKVVQPDGGQEFVSGSTCAIEWEDYRSDGNCPGDYLMDYSCDEGVTWLPVESGAVTGVCSYDWVVPEIDSRSCLVRIMDAADANVYDTSDETFVIRKPRVITVDDDGPADFTTIQAAVDDANDGDLVLVKDGCYTGDGNRDIDFQGKGITVRSESGPDQCVIDCNGTPAESHRGFQFLSGEDANSIVDGLTITGGYVSDLGTDETAGGGGVICLSSSPVIRNCIITNNQASDGGGIHCKWGEGVSIQSCRITANTGSGVFVLASSCSVSDCYISGNWDSGIQAWACGDSQIVRVRYCHISSNTASNSGDLRYNGGGILSYKCMDILVDHCVIVGNQAAQLGGGIYNNHFANVMRITHCTIANNTAGNAGGAVYYGELAGSDNQISDSIIWDNGDSPIEYYYSNPRVSTGMIQVSNSCIEPFCHYPSSCSQWTWVDNIQADPCFVEPGYWDDNATPEDVNDDFWVEGDYHLKSRAGHYESASQSWVLDDVTSPCIDTGDPLAPIGPESFPNGGRVNMGVWGATEEASKSWFGGPVCETIMAGDINGDCKVDFQDFCFVLLNWLREEI